MLKLFLLFILSLFLPSIVCAQTFIRDLGRSESGKLILSLNPRFITEEVRTEIREGRLHIIADRTHEANQLIDTLVRIKGRNPVLLGEAGVGKSAVVEKVAQMIVAKEIPTSKVYAQEILNSEIIQIDASLLGTLARKSDQGALLLVQAIKKVEKETRKSIILYIDEIHSADQDIWNALKTVMDAELEKGIRIIGASTEREFQYAFGQDDAMLRRFAPIGVSEFNEQKTVEIIKKSWLSLIEERYALKISDDVLEKTVKYYKKILPDVARPDGPIKVLGDLAVDVHRQNKNKISLSDLFSYIQKRTQLPADPQDVKAINTFIRSKNEEISKKIIGQDDMVRISLSKYRNLILSSGEKPEVMVFMGPTGVGKTYLAETLAEVLYGGKHRFFKIDGAAYSDEGTSLTGLLGARPGSNGYKETMGSGTLIEFLTNPGKGRYGAVILIDEIEKMHPERLKELAMNLFDYGEVTSGSGKKVRVSNLTIIATTNHGVNQIFPAGYESWSEEEISRRIRSYSQKDLADLFLQPIEADSDYKNPRELVKRIGTFIVTRPLNLESAISIAQLEAQKRKVVYKERNALDVNIHPDVLRYVTEQVYNKEDGVRDISRAIETLFSEVTALAHSESIHVSLVKEGAKKSWFFSIQNADSDIQLLKDHSFKGSGLYLSPEDLRDLKELQEKVRLNIFGQDELVEKATSAIRTWSLMPTNKPLTIVVVGSTGTGKTETAKVIAHELYGSIMKAQIIPMGDILRKEDLTKIFGANPQYIKADMMGVFEKALLQIKDGGVLVLDEISNAGGDNLSEKEAILTRFLNILEEGFWISPNTGRKYDLSKIIFWMTGNDLQDLYFGISGDDRRLAIWERNKDESIVRQKLRQKGFPESILGRAELVVHTKPLLDSSRVRIAKKLLSDSLANLNKQFPQLEVSIPESVYKNLVETFFNHDQGGRSIRNRFKSEVQSLVAQSLLESNTNVDNSSQRFVEISIIDNRSKKFYRIPNLKEEYFVKVKVFEKNDLSNPIITSTNNLMDKEEVKDKPDFEEFKKVAFHEIGHALLNNPSVSGMKLRYITIKSGSSGEGKRYLGYASYDPVKKQSSGVKEMKEALARMVAGRVSQEVGGFDADTGWGGDYNRMLEIISRFYIDAGLKKELWGARFDPKNNELLGTLEQKDFFAKTIHEEITEAEKKANEYLVENQGLVRFLVAQLIRKESLTGEQFDALVNYYLGRELTHSHRNILQNQFGRKTDFALKSCVGLFR